MKLKNNYIYKLFQIKKIKIKRTWTISKEKTN